MDKQQQKAINLVWWGQNILTFKITTTTTKMTYI